MSTETETDIGTRPIPEALPLPLPLPLPVALAGEYRAAIEALGNALQCQAGYAFRVVSFRQRLTELEARVTLAPENDGKNEMVRRAQVARALTGCDEWLQARDNAETAEHERDIAAGQAEVARERARYARTLLALLTAQTQAAPAVPAPAATPATEQLIAYQQGFDAACIGVLEAGRDAALAKALHDDWLDDAMPASSEERLRLFGEVASQVTADAVARARLASRERRR